MQYKAFFQRRNIKFSCTHEQKFHRFHQKVPKHIIGSKNIDTFALKNRTFVLIHSIYLQNSIFTFNSRMEDSNTKPNHVMVQRGKIINVQDHGTPNATLVRGRGARRISGTHKPSRKLGSLSIGRLGLL